MLAVSYTAAKNLAVGASVLLVIIGLLMAKNIAGMSRKLLSLIVFAALAFVVWNQRESLQTCAERVRTTGRTSTCRFFGNDVTVDAPLSG